MFFKEKIDTVSGNREKRSSISKHLDSWTLKNPSPKSWHSNRLRSHHYCPYQHKSHTHTHTNTHTPHKHTHTPHQHHTNHTHTQLAQLLQAFMIASAETTPVCSISED